MSYETLAIRMFGENGLERTPEEYDEHISNLREGYADLIREQFIDGKSPEEIAKERGLETDTINRTMNIALRKLEESMNPD